MRAIHFLAMAHWNKCSFSSCFPDNSVESVACRLVFFTCATFIHNVKATGDSSWRIWLGSWYQIDRWYFRVCLLRLSWTCHFLSVNMSIFFIMILPSLYSFGIFDAQILIMTVFSMRYLVRPQLTFRDNCSRLRTCLSTLWHSWCFWLEYCNVIFPCWVLLLFTVFCLFWGFIYRDWCTFVLLSLLRRLSYQVFSRMSWAFTFLSPYVMTWRLIPIHQPCVSLHCKCPQWWVTTWLFF